MSKAKEMRRLSTLMEKDAARRKNGEFSKLDIDTIVKRAAIEVSANAPPFCRPSDAWVGAALSE